MWRPLAAQEYIFTFLGDGLIFIRMENDIVYLRYCGERDIEPILEKVTENEYR